MVLIARANSHHKMSTVQIIILLLIMRLSSSDHIYISPSGVDNGSCRSPSSPCQTLDFAIQVATDHDQINLLSGTYFSSRNTLLAIQKSLSFYGENAKLLCDRKSVFTLIQASKFEIEGIEFENCTTVINSTIISDATIALRGVTLRGSGEATSGITVSGERISLVLESSSFFQIVINVDVQNVTVDNCVFENMEKGN